MPSEAVNLSVANGAISADNPNPTTDANDHVHFQIQTPGWEFNTNPTISGAYSSYRNLGNCGVYVLDPQNNFSLVENSETFVRLQNSNADKASFPRHSYAVFLISTDGNNTPLSYDPQIIDKGGSN